MYVINSHRFGTAFVQEGLYTEAQLDDLINIDGYIPIANEDDFVNFSVTVSQEMGVGTPWRANYTTGLDKKYVQIYNLNLILASSLILAFTGIYDGNELTITAPNLERSVFYRNDGTIKNLNTNITTTPIAARDQCGLLELNYGTIFNCHTILSSGTYGGAGFVGANQATGIIYDCTSNLSGSFGTAGGFVIENHGDIYDCKAFGTFTGNAIRVGGFVARNNVGGNIYQCSSNTIHTTVTGDWSGGFVGTIAGGTIVDCYFNGTFTVVAAVPGSSGGFVGYCPSAGISKCYSVCIVVGNLTKGFRGFAAGSVIDSYYDSTVSGYSDTGGGDPKTTTEMKEGAIPDIAIYITWSALIWDEGTTNDYPILI